jgi:hypothetical protein
MPSMNLRRVILPLVQALLCLALYRCSSPTDGPPVVANSSERIGVLVTGWGTVQGTSPEYNAELYKRAFLGERATAPDQPCTETFFGEFPFRSELGQIPFGVVFEVPGFEKLYDGYGVYQRSSDGQSYISILDPTLVLSEKDYAGTKIIPAREMPWGGRAFFFHPDPRDGTDHLAGYFRINKSNGLHDAFEQAMLSSMRRDALMGYIGRPPAKHKFQQDLENYLRTYVGDHFGEQADVRFGYYAGIPGISQRLEDVAVEYAGEGYTKLLIARETTDHNIYANVVWDRNHPLKALCRAGYSVSPEAIRMEHVRQVGRTPEYNDMLVKNLGRHLKSVEPGAEVSVIYATHGYPWPGSKPGSSAMTKAVSEINYVYHENAFLNFLSFKAYALAAFDESGGGDYRLNFTKSGGMGSSASRSNSLFGYAHIYQPLIGIKDDPLKFQTVRDVLETAIREDGRRELIIVLSHWYKDSNNTAVEIRELNGLPLNTIEEMNSGTYSITWCERYTAPGQYDQYRPMNDTNCKDDYARVQVTEAFNDLAEEFMVGYANRIRGGIERFGVFPDLDLEILAEGPVTKLGGGAVEVSSGELAGARLWIRPDPQPGAPESYTWDAAFRPATHRVPNTSDDALRPINEYQRIEDYLDGAKDDFTAYIGHQGLASPGNPMPVPEGAVSPTVYFGPYRTLLNAPAEVSIPYDSMKVSNFTKIKPMIFNEIRNNFDPVYTVSGMSPLRIDEQSGVASFDVQVLGNFVLVLDD